MKECLGYDDEVIESINDEEAQQPPAGLEEALQSVTGWRDFDPANILIPDVTS